MKLTIQLALLLCCGLPAAFAQKPAPTPSIPELRAGFLKPPPEARLRCYWWWLNGNTDKPTITHDLEEMKAKGYGGALLVDAGGATQNGNLPVPAGPAFGSPAWVELFTHALKEADRLGLEITLNIMSGWNLGGPSVTPEQASKVLTFTRTQLPAGAASGVHLDEPQTRNGFYRQIAVLAYPLAHGTALATQPDNLFSQSSARSQTEPGRSVATVRQRSVAIETGSVSMPDTSSMLNDGVHGDHAPFAADPTYADSAASEIKDISAGVSADGTLNWTPPPGDWEVLRIGYTDSGALVSTSSDTWKGLAIDYLSRAAFLQYWNETVEPLLVAAKPYHSLVYLASDSWELGGTNWTGDFRRQFLDRRGYDPIPWLPVVAGRIVGDRAQSTRFLTDLRRTVADLIATQHYDVFAEKAHEHGMGIEAESGGPHGAPLDGIETFRHSAVPQTEFWSQNPHRKTDPERFFTKEAASAVNIYGQRFVAQEGETSIGPQWSESLATDLKPSFDMAITEGMNRLVWHEFTSSPASTGLPGQEYFAGTHLNPKVTWWDASADFFAYLDRAQYLMQQGVAVDDVLYFYGDNIPNFARRKADDPAHVLPGYDYDVTDEDALLHTIRIDGKDLVGPSGVRWHLLALPRTRRVSMAVLELAERYVRGGGAVVGLPPTSVTGIVSPQQQSAFDTLAAKVWAKCSLGPSHPYEAGRVFCGDNAHAALASLGIVPDFDPDPALQKPYAASNSGVDYVHRRVGATEVYFVRNASASAVDLHAALRVSGKPAELWDPVTSTMQPAEVSTLPGQTIVSLHLAPYGSTFVVLGALPATKLATFSPHTEPLQLHGDWSLTFQPDRGAPTTPVVLDSFKSWSESADPAIRFFSGTAAYHASIDAPRHATGEPVWLQFTDVRDIARISINGHPAGTVWAFPYRLEVGKLLQPGQNRIDIEVTNLWPNRIIGDLQPGVTTRITSTNITYYKADSPLLPSGLIGPLTWLIGAR